MKHILVCTDFSACSTSAFALAKELQKLFNARLTLATVMEPGGQALLQTSHRIESLQKTYFHQLSTRTAIIASETNTAQDLTAYAASHEVDLILIGTHGRSGLKFFAFGSVTKQVLAHAECPVLVVPAHGHQKSGEHERFQMIVTTDLSPESEKSMLVARELLLRYGSENASLTILHVAENIVAATFNYALGESSEAIRGELETEAEQRLEALRARHFDGTLATTCVIRGNKVPYREIIDFADARDADLLILSSHGHSVLEQALIGSTSEKLVFLARRPVLVIPRTIQASRHKQKHEV